MLHEIFEEVAMKIPDGDAIQYEDGTPYTYQAIDRMANQFANYFCTKGIKPQEYVIVKLKRSAEQVVVLLALSKMGAVYVPISSEQPLARLAQMQADCKAQYCITTSDLTLSTGLIPIFLDKEYKEISVQPGDKPALIKSKGQIAYVAYSSGTTGEPKGIPISPMGLWQWRTDIRRSVKHWSAPMTMTRVMGNTSIDFDAHIWDYLMAWSFGTSLHITSEDTRKDVDKLAEFIIKHRITDMTLTPAVIRAFSDKQIAAFAGSGLRAIYSTGEACTKDIINRFSEFEIAIYNCYGPTEATFGLSMMLCSIEHFYEDLAPIGIPAPDSKIQIAIVDESGKPVNEGEEGRLLIMSPYVTKGYLNKPSPKIKEIKTSKGEIIHCFETDDKFLLKEGKLYCKGRIDHKAIVKIRGQLVDISGIENLLRRYTPKKIADAYVILRQDLRSDPVLIAYVICEETFTIEEMRKYCIDSGLLTASIPTYLENLTKQALPLTTSGKVDRNALAQRKFVFSRNSDIPFIAPKTDLEKQLADMWYKVLDISSQQKIKIGIKDPFVYYGGDSIKLMALKSEIKSRFDFNLSLSVSKIGSLEELTIEKLVNILAKEKELKKSDSYMDLTKTGSMDEPALFLLPSISGESTLTYGKLCQELKTTRSIYTLNSPLLTDTSLPIDSIPKMAEFYCSSILKIQPEGHICLAGWSSGGILASEVAYQLEKRGVSVDFVGIIDEIAPHIQVSLSDAVFAGHLSKLMKYFSDQYSFILEIDIDSIKKLSKKEQIEKIFELVPEVSLTAKNILKHVKLFLLSLLKYDLPKLENTPITIFKTKSTVNELKALASEFISLGWGECDNFGVTLLNGDHFSIIENPAELARKIDCYLQKLPHTKTDETLRKILEQQLMKEIHEALPSPIIKGLNLPFFSNKKTEEKEIKSISLGLHA